MFIVRSLMNDSSLGNDESVLLSFLGQIIGDLFDLGNVIFVIRVRHIDNQSRTFIFIVVSEFEFLNVSYLGVLEGLSVFRIGTS